MSDDAPGLLARLYVGLQGILPQHGLSRLMYRLARVEWPPLRVPLTWVFIRVTGIRMAEAAEPNPRRYRHLNALFTRTLRPELRPLDPDPASVLSPVDGTLSQIGTIEAGRLIQAKGQDFALADLLGGGPGVGRQLEGGAFATLYLSPKDYHRIHMPLSGDLTELVHVAGRLYSVNGTTAALVPGLFARNERVICRFETPAGPMVMVLVGAIFVGGIETVWAGELTPVASRHKIAPRHGPGEVRLPRGAEMGRFNLGSTVILLFPPGTLTWDPALTPGSAVRMGQRIGTLIHPAGTSPPAPRGG
ncbi:MAG: archaetidylserine decarboxylase [Bdellovibrio bacteriovorus]